MQPYFLPYLGYWKLINSVDKFIILDDVNFKKKGWIHKNFIFNNGNNLQINLCINKASINKTIQQHSLSEEHKWRDNLFSKVRHSYSKCSRFKSIEKKIQEIIFFHDNSLSNYLYNSILIICDLLKIKTDIVRSSSIYSNDDLSGEERIIDICKKEKADSYLNLPGGTHLYDKNAFKQEGIRLVFIKTTPSLSILDSLANLDQKTLFQKIRTDD